MIAALKYEWRRLWSIRATYVVSVTYLALVGLVAGIPIFLSKPIVAISWKTLYSTPAFFLCAVVISVIAAQTFGHEYRYGLIRLTLSEFPNRSIVILAKSIILTVYILGMTVLAWSVLGLIGILAPEGAIETGATGMSPVGVEVSALWVVPTFTIGYCFFTMSVTMITRNLPLGITVPLLLAAFVESLATVLIAMVNHNGGWMNNNLPMSNGLAWVNGGGSGHGVVFGCWVLALFAIGSALFVKRDA